MTTEHSQPEKDLPSVRKWTGLAKFLLIAALVVGGFRIFLAEPEEMITLLPSLLGIWGIYRFMRLGFYILVAVRLLSIALLLWVLPLPASDPSYESLMSALFAEVLSLVVASLIVRSRWKEMDPARLLFRGKHPPEKQ